MTVVTARAPGRVNLIGDHTDYTGGLVLPMAIDRETVVEGVRGGTEVRLRSDAAPGAARIPLDVAEPAATEPPWARYVAGVVAEIGPAEGLTGSIRSTLPVGVGLSSSAALEVAVALALGFAGERIELAQLCQRAEQRASGVPCGIMDQLTIVSGRPGHALLIDCDTLDVEPVPVPVDAEIVVVDSGERRTLAGSAYATRRRQCEEAAGRIGPLRRADEHDVARLGDPVLRRRARHVVTENARVAAFAVALAQGDLVAAGALMGDSHRSLRDDFEVSTPALDALVEALVATPGVFGARLTGAGFGGAAVALCAPGALSEGLVVRPSTGASVRIGSA